MRNIDLRKELKKRGLKGYSSLKKALLIEYLSTGIHPLKKTQISPAIVESEIHTSLAEAIDYSEGIFGKATKNLPVNQIITGDCLQILQPFPDGAIDCCVADPPFIVKSTITFTLARLGNLASASVWGLLFIEM